jgi:hypothetical protein
VFCVPACVLSICVGIERALEACMLGLGVSTLGVLGYMHAHRIHLCV